MHNIRNTILGASISILCGCSTINDPTVVSSAFSGYELLDVHPTIQQAASDIINGNYEDANTLLNQVLSGAPRDPLANLLNGMAYQSRTVGEGVLWDLAKVGYQLAQKFDPHLWQAPYLLGQMHVKERDFATAMAAFAAAALADPHAVLPLYSIAAVAYTQGELDLAYQAITQALHIDATPTIPQYHIVILCLAASGDFAAARAHIATFQAGGAMPAEVTKLERKVALWQALHANPATVPPLPAPIAATAIPNSSNSSTTDTQNTRMVIVDTTIVRMAAISTSHRGINLLNGLTAQFTGNIVNTGTTTWNADLPTTETRTLTDSLTLTVPSVTYTLNIVNSSSSTSRMVANPTILAFNGKMSKFFVGNEMSVFMGGNYASASFNKEFGLSVQVTPTFLSGDTLELQVETGFSTLKEGSPSGLIDNSSSILLGKIANTTSAVMRLGQTIAITTGTLYQEDNNRSQVPVLGDVPVIDTLFSKTDNSNSEGSFLILLTVRAHPEQTTAAKNIEDSIPARLMQRLIPIEAAAQQRLSLLMQRDLSTVVRLQDVTPISPLSTPSGSTTTKKWQQQFVGELLSGR